MSVFLVYVQPATLRSFRLIFIGEKSISALLLCVSIAVPFPAVASFDIFNSKRVSSLESSLSNKEQELAALKARLSEFEAAEQERFQSQESSRKEFEESMAKKRKDADLEFEQQMKEQEVQFETRKNDLESELAGLKLSIQSESGELLRRKQILEDELEIIASARKIAEEEIIYVPFADARPGLQGKIPDLITLRVGSREAKIRRNKFEYLAMSPLKAMFGGQFIPGDQLQNGAYVIDEDPDYFDHILRWIRYGRVRFSGYEEALLVRDIANKWCFDMLPAIDYYLSKNLPKPKLDIQKLQGKEDKTFFMCRTDDGQVIGNQNFGHANRSGARSYITEHEDRKKFGFLCLAWSGRGMKIYNTFNGIPIGQAYKDINSDELLNQDLISKAVPPYICSINGEDEFAVYNMINGHPVTPEQSFAELDSCLRYIRTTLTGQKLKGFHGASDLPQADH